LSPSPSAKRPEPDLSKKVTSATVTTSTTTPTTAAIATITLVALINFNGTGTAEGEIIIEADGALDPFQAIATAAAHCWVPVATGDADHQGQNWPIDTAITTNTAIITITAIIIANADFITVFLNSTVRIPGQVPSDISNAFSKTPRRIKPIRELQLLPLRARKNWPIATAIITITAVITARPVRDVEVRIAAAAITKVRLAVATFSAAITVRRTAVADIKVRYTVTSITFIAAEVPRDAEVRLAADAAAKTRRGRSGLISSNLS
jgi:hypothetical protein